MIVIDPRGMRDVVEWADMMFPALEEIAVPSRLFSVADWQPWAAELSVYDGTIPDPYQFDNWVEWVDRFNQTSGGA